MWATEALVEFVRRLPTGADVLEIGPGRGDHTGVLRSQGLRVVTVGPGGDVDGLWPWNIDRVGRGGFDGVWASHVLEHSANPGHFLDGCVGALRDGGVLAVTVPPRKDALVGGHLSLWTPGLLAYRAVLAGLDCSDARVWSYGYNVSLVVRKRLVDLPELAHDSGDIEKLARFFPAPVVQGVDGWEVVTE